MPKALRDEYLAVAPQPENQQMLFDKTVQRMRDFKDIPTDTISGIRAAALVIIGDAGVVRPEHAVEEFRLLPPARLAVLPGIDHMTLMSRSEWLVPMVDDFLDVPMPKSQEQVGGQASGLRTCNVIGTLSVDDNSQMRSSRSHWFVFRVDVEAGIDKSRTHVYTVYVSPESTAQQIATAARNLLDRDGEGAVTMRRVAASVGITPMAVYRHYPNHKELLNALADEGFRELSQQLAVVRPSGGLKLRLKKILDVNLDFALQNPRLFELMFLKPREGSRQFPRDFKAGKSPTGNLMAELIQEGMRTGYFRKDDVWEIVLETGAMLQGLFMLYVSGRVGMSSLHFRSLCHRSLWRYFNGIRK